MNGLCGVPYHITQKNGTWVLAFSEINKSACLTTTSEESPLNSSNLPFLLRTGFRSKKFVVETQ